MVYDCQFIFLFIHLFIHSFIHVFMEHLWLYCCRRNNVNFPLYFHNVDESIYIQELGVLRHLESEGQVTGVR